MAINKGYLTAGRTPESDECYTPFYAVEPLLEFIKPNSNIWCPFDQSWSAYVKLFKEKGFKVIYSHIAEGKDFFTYEPSEHYDIIISNPPYSIKDKILDILFKLNKPFAMLLPLPTLQGINRFKYFKDNIELLVFDKRVNFHTKGNKEFETKGNHFASIYFCKDLLPDKLLFRELKPYTRSLAD